MIVVSPDVELVRTVRDVIATRPLDLSVLDDCSGLAAIARSTWRETLVALLDVDTPGAWDFFAMEDRLGGVLFDVTVFVASARRIDPGTGANGDEGRTPPWSAAFTKPIAPKALLHGIDREIVFDDY